MKRLGWFVACLLVVVSVDAQAAKLIAVLPLDVSHAGKKLNADAQATLEEMLRDVAVQSLGKAGWTVLTGENTLRVLEDNGVDPSRCGDQSCHLSMAREIKAEKFLSGAIQWSDGEFTASIRLIDTASGRIIASERLEGPSPKALRKAFEARARAFFEQVDEGGTSTPTAQDNAAPLPAVPTAPKALERDSSMGLDADADVLVAYDAALTADKSGEAQPQRAAEAWGRVAALTHANPYRALATKRQKEWKEFDDKKRLAAQQRSEDTEKLRKLLPLGSLSVERKHDLLDRFGTAYGVDAVVELLPLTEPSEHRVALCDELLVAGVGIEVNVTATGPSGLAVQGQATADGKALGPTPGKYVVSLCTAKVSVSQPSTGAVWELPLRINGPRSVEAKATFRQPDPASLAPHIATIRSILNGLVVPYAGGDRRYCGGRGFIFGTGASNGCSLDVQFREEFQGEYECRHDMEHGQGNLTVPFDALSGLYLFNYQEQYQSSSPKYSVTVNLRQLSNGYPITWTAFLNDAGKTQQLAAAFESAARLCGSNIKIDGRL